MRRTAGPWSDCLSQRRECNDGREHGAAVARVWKQTLQPVSVSREQGRKRCSTHGNLLWSRWRPTRTIRPWFVASYEGRKPCLNMRWSCADIWHQMYRVKEHGDVAHRQACAKEVKCPCKGRGTLQKKEINENSFFDPFSCLKTAFHEIRSIYIYKKNWFSFFRHIFIF